MNSVVKKWYFVISSEETNIVIINLATAPTRYHIIVSTALRMDNQMHVNLSNILADHQNFKSIRFRYYKWILNSDPQFFYQKWRNSNWRRPHAATSFIFGKSSQWEKFCIKIQNSSCEIQSITKKIVKHWLAKRPAGQLTDRPTDQKKEEWTLYHTRNADEPKSMFRSHNFRNQQDISRSHKALNSVVQNPLYFNINFISHLHGFTCALFFVR